MITIFNDIQMSNSVFVRALLDKRTCQISFMSIIIILVPSIRIYHWYFCAKAVEA